MWAAPFSAAARSQVAHLVLCTVGSVAEALCLTVCTAARKAAAGAPPTCPLLLSFLVLLRQAMVGHHIQMLAVFWGGILVAVLFNMRRRLFRKPHHFHAHGRHRVPLSKLAV